jgi:hypothetical protein
MASEPRPFLILLSFSGPPNKSLNDAIGALSSEPVKPLMIGPGFIVLGIMWPDTAHALWNAVVKTKKLLGVKEMLILRAGADWCADRDKRAAGWLTRQIGNPGLWPKDDDI